MVCMHMYNALLSYKHLDFREERNIGHCKLNIFFTSMIFIFYFY